MAIGVDFILRASSAGFTQALAKANNALESTKKGLKTFDVGNGLKGFLGVGGVIEAFRRALNNAQDLRAEAEKLGKPVDANVASVARLADTVDDLGVSFKRASVDALSFFTKLGDNVGNAINRMRGISDETVNLYGKIEKDAKAAEARLAKSREDNAPEKVAAARDKLNETQSKTDDQSRVAFLLEKENKLRKEIAALGPETVASLEKQKELAEAIADRKQITARWEKEIKTEQDKRNEDARKELKLAEESDKKAQNDKAEYIKKNYAPNVDELAAIDVGTGVAQDDPRLIARKIKQNDERAQELFGRGDIKGGLKLAEKSYDLRQSLENKGASGEGGQLTQEKVKDAFTEALGKTNTELEGIKESLKGIIKAQR